MQIYECDNVIKDLKLFHNEQKAAFIQRFFKTKKGEYAQGDVFWGIAVPLVRKIARQYKDLDIAQIEKLLEHDVHEIRLCALLIMVFQSRLLSEQIYDLYVKKIKFVNNWDLVDLSAPVIVGNFLVNRDCSFLYKLAQSSSLWDRRIAIISSFAFIKQGVHNPTLKLAQILMYDKEDLIHKAIGWMLREVGKRCSVNILENFLEKHAATMPRTMLRYAIERLTPEKKKHFMQAKQRANLA